MWAGNGGWEGEGSGVDRREMVVAGSGGWDCEEVVGR